MTEPRVRVYRSLEELSIAAAAAIAEELRIAAERSGEATIALSGGDTPRMLHRLLAQRHETVPWARVHVYWGDERYVPHDDPRSNYRLARDTLLDCVPLTAAWVHPMPTDAPDPDDAAGAYQRLLEDEFGGLPRFDVMIMGLGEDGHTASLFPGSPAVDEELRWVVPAEATDAPMQRLTMTLPVLRNARALHFLVVGVEKREALVRALAKPSRSCPASLARPTEGTLTWWVDEAAAGHPAGEGSTQR